MTHIAKQIKNIAAELRSETSTNDPKYDRIRDIMDLCDEWIMHYIDDGR